MDTANSGRCHDLHDAVGSGDRHDSRRRRAARLVFEAWTNPEHLPHWMLGPAGWTMPVCEIDLRPGGAWHFVWRRSDGTEMEMRGVYQEIVPPERLVSTESWGGDWPETLNTLILSEEDGKTTITSTDPLPVEGGSRRGAPDGDEGWRDP